MNVAIARLRTRWLHAQCDDGIGIAGKLHAVVDDALEFLHIHHNMVGGSHHDVGLRVFLLDAPRYVGYAGGGVAPAWLAENVRFWHVGQLSLHNVGIFLIGHHPDVFRGNQVAKAFYCQLKEGLAYTKYVNELFGLLGSAHGPETATHASGHNNQMIVDSSHSAFFFLDNNLQKYAKNTRGANKMLFFACNLKIYQKMTASFMIHSAKRKLLIE